MRDDSVHFHQIYKMDIEDTVVTGLTVCGHIDVDARYYITCRMMLLSEEQIFLIWSVVVFMIKSLLPYVAFIDGSSRYHDYHRLFHQTATLSLHGLEQDRFYAYQFLQHCTSSGTQLYSSRKTLSKKSRQTTT
jgi:hypothetical protein